MAERDSGRSSSARHMHVDRDTKQQEGCRLEECHFVTSFTQKIPYQAAELAYRR